MHLAAEGAHGHPITGVGSACTIVTDAEGPPSNTAEMPAIPSRPIVATSTIVPSSRIVRTEQNPPPGKIDVVDRFTGLVKNPFQLQRNDGREGIDPGVTGGGERGQEMVGRRWALR